MGSGLCKGVVNYLEGYGPQPVHEVTQYQWALAPEGKPSNQTDPLPAKANSGLRPRS
jgi:hypothetical protein